MNTTKSIIKTKTNEQIVARIITWTAILLFVADTLYENIAGINAMNRETRCVIYTSLPRWAFLMYEHVIEIVLVVIIGIFSSVLIEQHMGKLKRFMPKNQLQAFLFGSILPLCSCGAIPLIESMKKKVSLRVIITFVIAAPLLNPYIIILAISIMGVKYTILRVLASFVLVVISGYVTEWFGAKYFTDELGKFSACNTNCLIKSNDPFIKTMQVVKKLLPYILIGGIISFAFELFNPKQILSFFNFSNTWLSMVLMTVVGIPIYVCNGADILLLKPLLLYTDLSLGTSLVFSMTSSVICISSIVLLSKFIGRKLTAVLAISVGVFSILIGFLINSFGGIL